MYCKIPTKLVIFIVCNKWTLNAENKKCAETLERGCTGCDIARVTLIATLGELCVETMADVRYFCLRLFARERCEIPGESARWTTIDPRRFHASAFWSGIERAWYRERFVKVVKYLQRQIIMRRSCALTQGFLGFNCEYEKWKRIFK